MILARQIVQKWIVCSHFVWNWGPCSKYPTSVDAEISWRKRVNQNEKIHIKFTLLKMYLRRCKNKLWHDFRFSAGNIYWQWYNDEACSEFSSYFWDAPQITGRSAVSQNVCCYLTISLLRALSASCACLWLEAGHRRQTEPGSSCSRSRLDTGLGMCSLGVTSSRPGSIHTQGMLWI